MRLRVRYSGKIECEIKGEIEGEIESEIKGEIKGEVKGSLIYLHYPPIITLLTISLHIYIIPY